MPREPKKIIKLLIICLAVLTIIGYSFYQARNLLFGPHISLFSPTNGGTFTDSLIEIKGNATNIASITLNDRSIFVDENGNFVEKLLLASGYNVFKLVAEDRFGRSTEKLIEFVLKDEPETTATEGAIPD